MPFGLMALVTVVMHMVSAQERGSNILRQGGSQSDQSEIVTSRTRAFLSCESGDMVVKVNFTLPFRGLMYAYRSRSSPCRLHGSGAMYYVLRIPLKGCGTWQESPRTFVNNITIRFHPALELEEDETKTVVCRYPPPLTPSPGSISIVEPVTTPTVDPTRVLRARLSEVEILIIICLLLFLSLLTLGIGIAYFCLKRRNIHLIRRKTLSSAPASQLTKLSGSTPQQPSLLSGAILGHTVRIPRAVPYSASLRTQTISDQPYDYQDNTLSSPVISRDSLDSSPTTSTTSGESADAADRLLLNELRAAGSVLTIPKAVLRKGERKRQTMPTLHKRFAPAISPLNRSAGELEDQTVTTVLEPEYNDDGNNFESRSPMDDPHTGPIPLYAQVDKKKQRVRIKEDAQIMFSDKEKRSTYEKPHKDPNYTDVKRKRLSNGVRFVEDNSACMQTKAADMYKKGKSSLAIENIKTSLPSKELSELEEAVKKARDRMDKIQNEIGTELDTSTVNGRQVDKTDFGHMSENKNVCIQDISDVYVTTTVETESTEIRTTVSRDIIEEHVKDNKPSTGAEGTSETGRNVKRHKAKIKAFPETSKFKPDLNLSQSDKDVVDAEVIQEKDPFDSKKTIESPSTGNSPIKTENIISQGTERKPSKLTDNWNVIIRQRKQSSALSDERFEEPDSKSDQKSKPRFDVKIRAIPPTSTVLAEKEIAMDRRDSTELVDVPQLKMPHSIEKIRSIIAKLDTKQRKLSTDDSNIADRKYETELLKLDRSIGSSTQPQKGVRWPENPQPMIAVYSPVPIEDISGSSSYRSETSLRERSSSEVLEGAPTLSANKNDSTSDNGLERSTSEILTSRGDHSKWVKDVPIFESYSPEFLSNIPVVTQGGFFHGRFPPQAKKDTDNKEHERPKS